MIWMGLSCLNLEHCRDGEMKHVALLWGEQSIM